MRPATRRRSLLLALAVAIAPTTAWTAPPNPLKPKPVTTAGALPPPKVAVPYAEARRLLRRGEPKLALRALTASKSDLLADREALLKGDALLALGQIGPARDAYKAAIEAARLPQVAIDAARGLVACYGRLDDRKSQLEWIDALLRQRRISRRDHLLLERASVLARLGQRDEATKAAWRVLQDFPASRVAGDARALLERLVKAGAKAPASNARLELARIRNLRKGGKAREALDALDALEKTKPKLGHELDVERAAALGALKRTSEELVVLERLTRAEDLSPKDGPEVYERLGRLAMRRDDDEAATRWFDALAARWPNAREAAETQFLAAWLPYNAGRYPAAIDRMQSFTEAYRRWPRRPEALWFGGWSAYLGGETGRARAFFDQILEVHPVSDMALWAHYWNARVREKDGDVDGAKRAYREVVKMSAMGYWGHWATHALGRLGETVVLDPPDRFTPATLEQAIAAMGSRRPINVDRGLALADAGLRDLSSEELRQAYRALRKVKATEARVMVAELLGQLGAHYDAFLLAARLTRDGADLVGGRPYAWRAWRLAYPKAFWDDVQTAATAHEIDPLLVLSIMRTESSFRPWVRSPVGARGLMQLMPYTAKRIGEKAEGGRAHAARYHEPASNIWLGAWYLKRLLERYDGQIALAAGAYNAGPGAMDRWLDQHAGRPMDEFVESLSYRETRRYVRRVLETYQVYRRLDGKPPLDLGLAVTDVRPAEGSVRF
jgi:soluble lytic murein transglycosylase